MFYEGNVFNIVLKDTRILVSNTPCGTSTFKINVFFALKLGYGTTSLEKDFKQCSALPV